MRAMGRFAMPSVLVLVGCAGIARNPQVDDLRSSAMVVRAHSRSGADGLDGEDLSTINQASLDVAIRQLRPEWFRWPASPGLAVTPTIVSVYVNLVYSGGIDALRLVPISAVRGVRHLTPSAARDRFGPACPCSGGAILVSTVRTPDAMVGVVW